MESPPHTLPDPQGSWLSHSPDIADGLPPSSPVRLSRKPGRVSVSPFSASHSSTARSDAPRREGFQRPVCCSPRWAVQTELLVQMCFQFVTELRGRGGRLVRDGLLQTPPVRQRCGQTPMARRASDRREQPGKGQGSQPEAVTGHLGRAGRNWGLCGWRPPGALPQGRKKGVGTVLPKYYSDHAPGESGAAEPGNHATPWLPSPLCLLTQETSSTFSILPAGTQTLELDVIRSKPSSATCQCDLR